MPETIQRLIALTLVTAAGACGSSSAPAQGEPVQHATPPAASRPHDRAYPQIHNVSPEAVDVRDGIISSGTPIDLTYSVENASLLKRLRVQVHVPGIGDLQTLDVEKPADDGPHHFEFSLKAGVDVGPSVRFRVRCPATGDTEWMSLGHPRWDRVKPTGVLPQILGVGPEHTSWSGEEAEAILVTLSGRGFEKDCTPEAQINGSSLDLVLPYVQEGRFHIQLPYKALNFRSVGARYLEIELQAESAGYPVENIAYVRFSE